MPRSLSSNFGALAVEVLPQGRIDERLIPGGASGFLRRSIEASHNMLVQPDRDSGDALGLGFRWKHFTQLPLLKSY